MMKRTTLAVLAFAATIAAPVALHAQSLSQALSDAYNNSGLLEQNRALLRAADEDVAQAVAATLPVLSWSITADRTGVEVPVRTGTNNALARITANIPIYSGGTNQLAIEAQKETVLGTRQSLRAVEQDVLLRAVQAYANLVRDTEFVRLRQNNVRVITQEFRAAQDRFEVGEVTRTDVATAEARLANARSLLASAQGNLAISAEEFRVATGEAPTGVRGVSPAPVTRSLTDSQAFAVRNHPSILQAQHTVSAAELNIRRAEASLRPSVSGNAFIATDQDSNESAQIGVTISGPIYSGGLISSQIRQARSNRDSARSGLHLTVLGIEQQVANAYATLLVSRASREASDQQISAARVAFEGVREEATLGSRTTLDVLNAEQELLDAEANRIAAVSDEVVASYSLLSAMGLLTADHLNLPVQQYDPTEYYNLVKGTATFDSERGQALDRILDAIGQE
ncbi:MAG: TolC family outer membrane protein [Pseudomonadota bacterium]